jgi:hypothetical protein
MLWRRPDAPAATGRAGKGSGLVVGSYLLLSVRRSPCPDCSRLFVVGGSVGRGFGGETTDAAAEANAGKTRGRAGYLLLLEQARDGAGLGGSRAENEGGEEVKRRRYCMEGGLEYVWFLPHVRNEVLFGRRRPFAAPRKASVWDSATI